MYVPSIQTLQTNSVQILIHADLVLGNTRLGCRYDIKHS